MVRRMSEEEKVIEEEEKAEEVKQTKSHADQILEDMDQTADRILKNLEYIGDDFF